MKTMRRRSTYLTAGALLVLALLSAPIANAAVLKFKCESGNETFEGQGYCYICHYTICCVLYDDGTVDCVDNHTCRPCDNTV